METAREPGPLSTCDSKKFHFLRRVSFHLPLSERLSSAPHPHFNLQNSLNVKKTATGYLQLGMNLETMAMNLEMQAKTMAVSFICFLHRPSPYCHACGVLLSEYRVFILFYVARG